MVQITKAVTKDLMTLKWDALNIKQGGVINGLLFYSNGSTICASTRIY
ncbi:hypothetical protein NOK60_06035 [Escherichia coli]|nr:hypothetical protein [Escherichia coli]MDS0559048.1 hypothetical protein [Escherichia coli]